jgi:hypothetical protein
MNPLGGGKQRGRRNGGAWKDGVAHTASLNGRRRSEKAKVLEKAYPDIQGLKSPRISKHTFTRRHTHTSCTTSRGFGWRIHCGVKVTEISTNKQHTRSHTLPPLAIVRATICHPEPYIPYHTNTSPKSPKHLAQIPPTYT